ncbi:MAG: hypothetical protein UX38_C0004G0032 [Microgenomates group bacterium GW2011_GWC1_46_16]|nr:MAG: hypothetical protein UX38_C0004G0032 [Microgenomates group bacterium GW2011_GWC1_46_16]
MDAGESGEHGFEIFVDTTISRNVDFAFFDGGRKVKQEILDFVFVGAQTTSGDGESKGAVAITFDGGIFVFADNSWIDGATGNLDTAFVDFVAQDIGEFE